MNKNQQKNLIKNNRGVVLLLTLLILSSILVVTLGVADLVFIGVKMNRLTGYSGAAFFASEAGLERALWEARKNGYTLPESDQTDIFTLNNIGNGGSYNVNYATSSPSVVFRSIGTYKGVKRSVEGTYESW
jgi:hypothetical protein